jgi:predicted dehydrogenase
MSAQRREYRVGQVGYRGRGRALAEYWRAVEGATLVALADDVPEHLDEAKKEFGEIATYTSHTDMLENENLDVVTIGTRAGFRPPIVKDAVAKGVQGIYMEKPVADSLAEADAMIEQCRAGGTVLTIGHQRRWSDHFRWVRKTVKEGGIGRPTHGYLFWSAGRVGSNGTHFLDAVSFAIDSAPVDVAGTVQYGLDLTKTDDNPSLKTRMEEDPGVMGMVTYANGFRLAVDAMNDVLLPFTWIFCGTGGRIDLVQQGDWEIEYRARDKDLNYLTGPTITVGDFYKGLASSPMEAREPPALATFDDAATVARGYSELISCIETGAESSSSGEDARMALETIVGFHISAENGGKAVSLPIAKSDRSFKLKTH